jgi:hypothetical protein
MTPQMQAVLQQAQAAQEQALWQMKFFGYSSYAAILICALFTVLLFWKLCAIEKRLKRPWQGPGSSTRNQGAPPPSPGGPFVAGRKQPDESRYMPKPLTR